MIPDESKDVWFINNLDFIEFSHPQRIPQILHMVWVGDSEPPDTFQPYVDKWKQLMPHWNVRIWRNEDITEEHFPANILEKINNSTKGAQKCDIMKYHIIEKYGGVYMDADVIPHRSLDPIIYDLNGAEVVLCHDNLVTWEYMAVGFFAAVPHHQLLKVACQILETAEINTPDIHLKTGPQVMGLAMSRANNNPTKFIVIPTEYFYINDWNNNRFGFHTYAHNW